MSTKLDPFEKQIMQHLKFITGNRSLKADDLLEWSSQEATIDKGLLEGEAKVHVPALGVWCAIPSNKAPKP